MSSPQSSIVVIGGGIAGITAALSLLDYGLSVTLIDRDTQANLGGLARESFGGMFVVDSAEQRRLGIRDSVDLAYEDWCSFAQFGEDEHWPQRWAQAYVSHCHNDVYLWLKQQGVSYFPVPNWVERGQYRPGNSVPRFHLVWGTGARLIECLRDKLDKHPRRQQLILHFNHRVDNLITSNGGITGCSGVREDNGAPFEFVGDAVIVATGGINGCLERVRQNWHPDWGQAPKELLNGSHKYADGTLHDAVSRHGASVTHLNRMWNYAAGVAHFAPRKPHHGLSLVPPRSALWVDASGERFGPEPLVTGFDTRELVRRICASDDQYSWQVFNWKIGLKELAVSGAEFNPSVRDRKAVGFLRDVLLGNRWLMTTLTQNCKDFVCASNLNDLVTGMNALTQDDKVSATRLKDGIRRYDAQIDRKPALMNDEQLRRIDYLRRYRGDKIRTCHRQKILDDSAGPLIAVRERIISRKSLGGIATDLESRVLAHNGHTLPRLYAIGEAAGFGGGGMHGLRALEGTFLGGCVLSARAAAASLAGVSLLK